MRVLHVIEKPRYSGAEILVKDLSLKHSDKLDVGIASFHPPEKDFEDVINLLSNKDIQLFLPVNSLSKLQRITFLFNIFKNFKPDVVIGHSAVVSAYTRLAGYIFPKIKKIIVLHAAAADYENDKKLQLLEYLLQYFTDVVVGVSDWSSNIYSKRYTVPTVKTIYNGIDLEKFTNKNNINRTEIRRSVFGASPQNKVILQVGRINPVKNQLLTLKAISVMKRFREDIIIVFVGIIEDKFYYNKLVDFCKRNNLINQVKFLGARNDINQLLLSSDIYVMPSERENFSIALLEALSTGIPVIISDIPQFKFLERHDFKNLYKFNLNNLDEFRKNIEYILENKIGFVKRDLKKFSIDKTLEDYLKLFKEIVENG